MDRPSSSQFERQAEALLKGWLNGDARFEKSPTSGDGEADVVVRTGRQTLVVEVKATADPGSIAQAAEQVRRTVPKYGKTAIPVLVVPFMTDVGRRTCEQAGVSWFDLSG